MATFAKEEVSRIINYSESLGLGPLSPSQAGGIIPMYGDPENPRNLNNRHTPWSRLWNSHGHLISSSGSIRRRNNGPTFESGGWGRCRNGRRGNSKCRTRKCILKRVVMGVSGLCSAAEPSQNKKRTRGAKTEEKERGKQYVIARG